jgi:hypothetical protein
MFKMAVRIAYRIEGRCSRHRAYNPMKDEQGGIKGECAACYELLNAYRAYLAFREAIEKFETMVHPFITTKKARGGSVNGSRTSATGIVFAGRAAAHTCKWQFNRSGGSF